MKKKEIIFFAVLIVVAAAVLLILSITGTSSSKRMLITVDGEEYKNLILTDNTNMRFTIQTPDGYNEVVITDGVIDVVSADCKNQVCVETKSASNVNDKIVCLPHKIVIEVIDNSGETD